MRKNDQQYKDGFNDELKAFIGRVKERAQARIDKAVKEYEEVTSPFFPFYFSGLYPLGKGNYY